MAQDLYTCDLDNLDGQALLSSIRALLRLEGPPTERPAEGLRLDLKLEWSDSALKAVCSLANTFGGLLVVGVEDHDGKPGNLEGFDEKGQGETKIRIASAIQTNIYPPPVFRIGVCSIDERGGKVAAVISVSESPEICMLTKKDLKNPVYVRNADGCVPADASLLRRLIDKERKFFASDFGYSERETSAYEAMEWTITGVAHRNTRQNPTWFRACLLPRSHPRIVLDRKVERGFLDEIRNTFDRHDKLLTNREWLRGPDFVAIRARDQSSGHRRCWYASSAGDVGFGTDVSWDYAGEELWSLYDLLSDIFHLSLLASRWWQANGYLGSFRIAADLCVAGLKVRKDSSFQPCLYDRVAGPVDWVGIDTRAVLLSSETASHSVVTPSFDFEAWSGPGDLQMATVDLANDLLRGLGHATDRQLLGIAVRHLL